MYPALKRAKLSGLDTARIRIGTQAVMDPYIRYGIQGILERENYKILGYENDIMKIGWRTKFASWEIK